MDDSCTILRSRYGYTWATIRKMKLQRHALLDKSLHAASKFDNHCRRHADNDTSLEALQRFRAFIMRSSSNIPCTSLNERYLLVSECPRLYFELSRSVERMTLLQCFRSGGTLTYSVSGLSKIRMTSSRTEPARTSGTISTSKFMSLQHKREDSEEIHQKSASGKMVEKCIARK